MLGYISEVSTYIYKIKINPLPVEIISISPGCTQSTKVFKQFWLCIGFKLAHCCRQWTNIYLFNAGSIFIRQNQTSTTNKIFLILDP